MQCNEFVEDMRTICQEIADLDEQQIPLYLHEKFWPSLIREKFKDSYLHSELVSKSFLYGIMTVYSLFCICDIFIFMICLGLNAGETNPLRFLLHPPVLSSISM